MKVPEGGSYGHEVFGVSACKVDFKKSPLLSEHPRIQQQVVHCVLQAAGLHLK
jgi:hypothetical protein